MRLRVSSFSQFSAVTVALAMLLVMPLGTALAAPSNPGGTDYDIPISELNKVKKKVPTPRANREPKKKKKNAAKLQESSSSVAAPPEPAGQAHTPPVESVNAHHPEAVSQRNPDADKPLPGSEDIRIYHTPYSFVVAGKHTVIHAVISGKAEIKEVTCRVSAADSGVLIPVKMDRVTGSRFTYVADLPPLPPGTSALRYTIDAVDSQGGKNRSNEFVTPVSSSPVVPGWQSESSSDAVLPGQEAEKKPRTGVSAPEVPRK